MAKSRSNPDFMNGVPELLVLKLLSQRQMYGYELVREIQTATEREISLGEGAVYPTLHDLERHGHLSSSSQTVDGRRRIYYSLTPKGVRRLTKVSTEWGRLTRAIGRALGAQPDAASDQ